MSAAPVPTPQTDVPPRLFGGPSLALLAAALVWHLLPFSWPTNRFDTGIHLCAADLIRAGRVPYADFQTLYTPGSYHLLAWCFAVFGRAFDVHAHLDLVLCTLNAWGAWHVAARVGGCSARALVAFAAGLAYSYAYPSLLLAVVAVLAACRPAARDALVRAVLAGVAAGVAGWFRQDFGAVAAVAAAVAHSASLGGERPGRRLAGVATVLAVSAATLAALLAPALVAAPRAVWEGLVVNPLATVPFRDSSHQLRDAFSDGVFAVSAVTSAVAIAVLAGAAVAPLFRSGMDLTGRSRASAAAGLAVVGVWCVRYVALRADTHHLVPAGLVLGIAGAVLPAGAATPASRRLGTLWFLVASTAVALPLARGAAAHAAQLAGRRADKNLGVGDLLPRAATLHLPPREGREWMEVVRRVREVLPPGAAVLSACARHDRIFDQDLLLYFALDRLPPVRDYHFDPGVTTRADVQEGIVRDAEAAGVEVVVLYDSRSEPTPPGMPPGARVLDTWIAGRFLRSERIGRYEIRTR